MAKIKADEDRHVRTIVLPVPSKEWERAALSLTHEAKNLYNTATFLIRQINSAYRRDEETGEYVRAGDLHTNQNALDAFNRMISVINDKRSGKEDAKLVEDRVVFLDDLRRPPIRPGKASLGPVKFEEELQCRQVHDLRGPVKLLGRGPQNKMATLSGGHFRCYHDRLIGTKLAEEEFDPLPSWPTVPVPQHPTSPQLSIAQAASVPASIFSRFSAFVTWA